MAGEKQKVTPIFKKGKKVDPGWATSLSYVYIW